MGSTVAANVDDIWPPGEALWVVRALGPLDVVSANGDRPKFRSRSVQALLCYLLLHLGEDVSRFLLEETIWPESDCVKQAQNLRRAVADLRDALEFDEVRGKIVETRRDIVSANSTFIVGDSKRFFDLSERGLSELDPSLLSEAIALYRGPLLEGSQEAWIYPYRLEFEERFGQCIEATCQIKVEAGSAKEAVRLGRSALLLAPSREDIHISLIQAYRSCGLETEALRQFEDLERMMDENWGEPPSLAAREALEGKLTGKQTSTISIADRPHIAADSEPSGGALSPQSRFYVRRSVDIQAELGIDRGEGVILLQGPRQTGKSSLLARVLEHGRRNNISTILCDFQSFGESQLGDEEKLYKTLAHSASTQLGVHLDLDKSWSSWLGPNMNLDAILGLLLTQKGGRVCWAIDEADRLFGRPYADDFFGLLRSWHNRRALDPGGPWSKLTLVIAYASEAHMFISDINQSPFNVGIRLPMKDFSIDEVRELASRYGNNHDEDISGVFGTTNGHPFLTRRAFSFLSQGGTFDQLKSFCSLPDGLFGDHLQALLGSILQDAELVHETKRLLSGEPPSQPILRMKLLARGVLSSEPNSAQFRVPAYADYLRVALL